jgi:hypothetical protein
MDITYSVPDSVGKEIQQLPNKQAIEALQLAFKRFRKATESQQTRKEALQALRNFKPTKVKMTAEETVRKMRDDRDTRNSNG